MLHRKQFSFISPFCITPQEFIITPSPIQANRIELSYHLFPFGFIICLYSKDAHYTFVGACLNFICPAGTAAKKYFACAYKEIVVAFCFLSRVERNENINTLLHYTVYLSSDIYPLKIPPLSWKEALSQN